MMKPRGQKSAGSEKQNEQPEWSEREKRQGITIHERRRQKGQEESGDKNSCCDGKTVPTKQPQGHDEQSGGKKGKQRQGNVGSEPDAKPGAEAERKQWRIVDRPKTE